MKKKREIHPAIFELKDDFEKGKLTRREFIRALLGMSVSMAGPLLGCAKEEKEQVQPAAKAKRKSKFNLPPKPSVAELSECRGQFRRSLTQRSFPGSYPQISYVKWQNI
jgi:hypothetical protein